jgi:hypothetical protein
MNDLGVDQVLGRQLRMRAADADEWRIWEYKTLNIHRGVLCWRPRHSVANTSSLIEAIRQKTQESFRAAWWRGFGFGVVVECPIIPADIGELASAIDTRANGRETWQWTVIIGAENQVAFGVHTWKEGYLSPTHRGLLAYLETIGYHVGSFKKEKDKLMQFIATIAKLKGVEFSEFQP